MIRHALINEKRKTYEWMCLSDTATAHRVVKISQRIQFQLGTSFKQALKIFTIQKTIEHPVQ